MGQAATELADRVIVTSDNPRSERPGAIVEEILSGIPEGLRTKVVVHVDRARAIVEAILGAQPGDVIVIAGKGHETEQLFVDESGRAQSIHFDDREHARAALVRRRGLVTPVVPPTAPVRRPGSGPSGVQGKWGRTEAPRS
jgi:UDP-N-acetylmuramyl tripeptide synthase